MLHPRLAALVLAAQLSGFAAQTPAFEVASVKPVNPPAGPHVVSLLINHGRVNVEAGELRQIVGLAYAIQRVPVLGGPGWADSDQFDIAAKAESADATRDEVRAMLQALLAERFKLVTHRDHGPKRPTADSVSVNRSADSGQHAGEYAGLAGRG